MKTLPKIIKTPQNTNKINSLSYYDNIVEKEKVVDTKDLINKGYT